MKKVVQFQLNDLVNIPSHLLKAEHSYMADRPCSIYRINNNKAEFLSAHGLLRIPLSKLSRATLPYFNYHKDESKIIIVDSRFENDREIYTAAFNALKAIDKYSDGGSITCSFTDDSLKKIRVKGSSGQKTFTIEELQKY